MKYRWGELITLKYGKPVDDKARKDGNYPVYGTNGLIGTTNHNPLCPIPSFVIGRKGAYRGVTYSDRPFSVIDTGFYVLPKTKCINLRWAYYKFLTYDINKMDSGSAIPSTDRNEIYSIEVDLPPLTVQEKAVEILSSIDNKIRYNTLINKNLLDLNISC